MKTLFTIYVAPIMYVVRKFISEHLSYRNYREKHAPHLMHGSPLEDIALLSLFYFFHLSLEVEEGGLAHILYSNCGIVLVP